MALYLTDLDRTELEAFLASWGAPPWRAGQVLRWIYARRATGFGGMSDLPEALRARLAEEGVLRSTGILREQAGADGTRKFLVGLRDGQAVEGVLIPERRRGDRAPVGVRWTLCVSTQVGCPVRCVFCASGMDGLKRNLAPGEIVEQVLHALDLRAGAPDAGGLNLVLMGMGEPMLNPAPVRKALEILHARWGLGIGWNRITLSTIGIPGTLEALVAAGVTPNLAISLHAPNDAVRDRLVPMRKRFGVADAVAAARRWRKATGKEVTFEYVLLAGENDAPAHARELARRVAPTGCKVNLIPYNAVEGLAASSSPAARVEEFRRILEAGGVTVTVRRRRGEDIDAACGQLRRTVAEKP
jgi:23S rRNA (adenine2503-C2)-methyltransferase